jgi:peptidoglycan/LPS O-acetylase OafA/YrhL
MTEIRDAESRISRADAKQTVTSPVGTAIRSHRRDIDGLRAAAVIPVILFHLHARGFGGGFLGVDVFFVISGYLISRIVFQEILGNKFSLQAFYERRVRRIFPALFAVSFFCLVIGYFEMLPNEFTQLSQSVVATTLFCSNFFFFHQSNYFAPASVTKPLLHTWSLAVEEQFYIVLPLFLWFAVGRINRRTIFLCIATAACLSLAANFLLLPDNEAAAFFLPGPRAWELLLGCMLALDVVPKLANRFVVELCGIVGIALLAGSMLVLNEERSLAYPIAIWPCIGAALVIYSGAHGQTASSRLLGIPPCEYIGRISYSLYMWHWPIIVFYCLFIKFNITNLDKAALFAAILVTAAISERYIERPFRKTAPAAKGRTGLALGAAAGLMAAFTIAGVGISAARGFESRFPSRVVRMESFLQYGDLPFFRTDTCFLSTDSNNVKYYSAADCLTANPAKRNMLIMGDSHAADLWYGLSAAYPDINFLQATVARCPPLLGGRNAFPFGKACDALMGSMFFEYIPSHKLDGIIIASRWRENSVEEIGRTVSYLKKYQRHVYVVGPNVEYSQPVPRVVAIGIWKNDLQSGAGVEDPERLAALERRIQVEVQEAGGTFLSLRDALCERGICAVLTPDDTPIDFDTNHLSAAGSRFVAERWKAHGLLGTESGATSR